MLVRSSLRHLRISPRKVRLVVNELRGLRAQEALDRLRFLNKRVALPLAKLLTSAIANAEHNFSLETGPLVISDFKVDAGPTLKRFRPKGFGRASLIQRRTSHVTLVLEGDRLKKIKEADKAKAEKIPEEALAGDVGDKSKMEKPDQEFETEKKVGQERKPSFVKRLFRRKSI